MSDTPNYSAAQVAELVALAEKQGFVSYFDCIELGEDWGKGFRSVISKVKSLELPYQPKPKPQKRVTKEATKSEIVDSIAVALDMNMDGARSLQGLNRATASALVALLDSVHRLRAE